ncbi:MAG: hypothetical protein WCK63_06000 [Betaproteobacteria bacterium]
MRFLGFLLLLCSLSVVAGEKVSICFNYGCVSSVTVVFSKVQLKEVRELLDDASDAQHERELIAVVIGRLLGWAGKQSPIWADKGGNYADEGVSGKMDCIDHSTTTTRLLKMLAGQGWLRWHRVLEPQVRTRLIIFDHWSAVIEEEPKAPFRDEHLLSRVRYAVDSWYNDNGKPAVVMPLDHWLDWEGPDAQE